MLAVELWGKLPQSIDGSEVVALSFIFTFIAGCLTGAFLLWQVRTNQTKGFRIRIAKSPQTEDLIEDLRELGEWETPAEAVEAALSYYRWALVTEVSARFFIRSRGRPDLVPVRVFRNSSRQENGETFG